MSDFRILRIGQHLARVVGIAALGIGTPVLAGCSEAAQEHIMITPGKTAHLVLPAPPDAAPGSHLLEVTVKPVTIEPDEKFLLVIKAGSGLDAEILDTLAFFPPPIPGKEHNFLIDLSSLPHEATVDVALELLPVEKGGSLTSAELEITGTRWLNTRN